MAELTSKNNQNTITVSSNNLKYYTDLAKSYRDEAITKAELAKNWASKTEGTVDGIEYSSKYYANLANNTVKNALTRIEDAKTNALNNISTDRQEAENSIDMVLNSAIESIETSKSQSLENIELETTAKIQNLIDESKVLKDNLNARKNELITEINTQVKSTQDVTINSINAAGKEQITNINEQLEIANTKVQEASEYAQNSKDYSELAVSTVDGALNSITDLKDSAVNEINTLKTETLMSIENKGTSVNNNIEEIKTNAVKTISSLSESISTDIEEKKNQALDMIQGKVEIPLATSNSAGIVKPDNKTITIDEEGTLSCVGSNIETKAAFDSLPLFYNFYSQETFNSLMYKEADGSFLSGNTYETAYNNLIQRIGIDNKVKLAGDETISDYDFVINREDKTFRLPLESARVLVEKYFSDTEEEGYKWYELYSDGKLIQGGYISTPNKGDYHITFVKPYTLSWAQVSLNIAINRTAGENTTAEAPAFTRGATNEGFSIYKSTTTGTGYNWRVEGFTEKPVNTGWHLYYKLGNSVENLEIINAANTVDDIRSEFNTLLNEKQDLLTFDSIPTENSVNPITSDGVFKALQKAGGNIESPENIVTTDTEQEISGNKTFTGTVFIQGDTSLPGIYLKSTDNGEGCIRARTTDLQFIPLKPDWLKQSYYMQFDGTSGDLLVIKNYDDYSVLLNISDTCRQIGNVSSVLDAINGEVA